MVNKSSLSKTSSFCIGAGLALLASAVSPAAAASSDWTDAGEAKIRLIAAETAVGEADSVMLGLHIRLDPGWKTYWRSAGDAGAPPDLDWTGSRNVAATEVLWPAPVRFSAGGIDSFGYAGEVVLPVRAVLRQPGAPASFRLHVDYSFCERICVPAAADLALSIPAGPAGEAAEAALIARYLARVPRRGDGKGMRLEQARIVPDTGSDVLELTARADEPFVRPDVMVEAAGSYSFDRPRVAIGEGGRTARLLVPFVAPPDAKPLPGQEVTVTLVDGARAVEARLSVAGADEPPSGRR